MRKDYRPIEYTTIMGANEGGAHLMQLFRHIDAVLTSRAVINAELED